MNVDVFRYCKSVHKKGHKNGTSARFTVYTRANFLPVPSTQDSGGCEGPRATSGTSPQGVPRLSAAWQLLRYSRYSRFSVTPASPRCVRSHSPIGLSKRMRRKQGCRGRGAEFTTAAADRLSRRLRGPGPAEGCQCLARGVSAARARASAPESRSHACVITRRPRANPAPRTPSMALGRAWLHTGLRLFSGVRSRQACAVTSVDDGPRLPDWVALRSEPFQLW